MESALGEGTSLDSGDIENLLHDAEQHLDPNVVEQTVGGSCRRPVERHVSADHFPDTETVKAV
ncbi:hypothetical protein ACFY8K_03420 [Streptomyces misionensis]|uniref:hypothetical protein n=1 Tax=Streptomyces misionensis TaxID=67331 RepID=UPI003674D0C2